MELLSHGTRKYPRSALLSSSSGLGWSAISAELRSHQAGKTALVIPQDVELCLVIAGNDDGVVIRANRGQREEIRPSNGAIWLSPAGIDGNQISITAPIPRVLHLYLPTVQFQRLADDFNLPGMRAHSIRNLAGLRDEVIYHIGLSIVSAMSTDTAAGRMYVETASMTLAARLLEKYSDPACSRRLEPTAHRMDHIRLRRALDYISAHLEEGITLTELAQVAGVSVFHFARTFTRAIGVSPSRYVSRLRLEKSMADIAVGKLSLAEIAFRAGFSSQASFTRAFCRLTGRTPGEYRMRRA